MTLDVSRMGLGEDDVVRLSSMTDAALDAMAAIEDGGVANVDEERAVGHYWLRAPNLAPSSEIRREVRDAIASVRQFAADVHAGAIRGAHGDFGHLVHVGIGGSALGPELVCEALAEHEDRLAVHFLDNADPDGVDRLLTRLDGSLGETLVSVVSKSGWTPTPLQVLVELECAYSQAGIDFARHAVATTMPGSALDVRAATDGWLARFPLWDWVGGRTSVTSAVGLLPAALQGVDVTALLAGAAAMDLATRARDQRTNPAVLLALAWYCAGNGRGDKHMVILPYKDRLVSFPRYVQQLVMESIGKRFDRSGEIVEQGLTVYGYKGSTDQHSYAQQLIDGRNDFFVTFIAVDKDRDGQPMDVEPGLALGDFLFGHLEGTRNTLSERGRESLTITVPDVSPHSLGALVALYERAVGIYAELVNVNAYHQPAVDKDAARRFVEIQRSVARYLQAGAPPQTAEDVAAAVEQPDDIETVFKVLERLTRDPARGIVRIAGLEPFDDRFGARAPDTGP